ncbi:MAG TPA: zinc-dependent metalloprotease [Streptosporangiaceae bacterium]|jgi:putative hydrolase
MTGPPFGFGLPGNQDEGSGEQGGSGPGGSGPGGSGPGGSGPGGSGPGGSGPGGGQGGPLGPLGDPQQFADALRQFADLMAWQGGPVNWDLAKNVARQTVAAQGDPSVLGIERGKIIEALRLADLWLEEATVLPTGIRAVQAWSRSEWVEATLPVWARLCDPIAAKAVEAMGGAVPGDLSELGGELPPEMRSAMSALTGGMGGLGGLGEMLRRVGGMMVGGQIGAAVGALAEEVVSSTDIGLPLGPEGTAALLPTGVTAFGQGLSVTEDEVRLFLALREAAHQRLFAHVPWLRARLFAAVEDYARGITVDASALRDAMQQQVDPSNPEALSQALSGGGLFQPEDTPQQKAALARLETILALVEGWVAVAVADAADGRLPQAGALAEAIRRRRATGGPAERTFATLVGLELRPRRLREAAAIWHGLTEARGIDGRDAVWAHPDLLPTADDFDDPDGFVRGRPELDISDLDEGGTGSAGQPREAEAGPADGAQGDGGEAEGGQGEGGQGGPVAGSAPAADSGDAGTSTPGGAGTASPGSGTPDASDVDVPEARPAPEDQPPPDEPGDSESSKGE